MSISVIWVPLLRVPILRTWTNTRHLRCGPHGQVLDASRMVSSPVRVMFVMPRLSVGGCERVLSTLLPELDRDKLAASLVCVGPEWEQFSSLEAKGISCIALDTFGGSLRAYARLVGVIRSERPDVVVTLGIIHRGSTRARMAAMIAGVKRQAVWLHGLPRESVGVRARFTDSLRRLSDRWLIPWTHGCLGVAEAQRRFMTDELHYPAHKVRIIPNGVDPGIFDITSDRQALVEFGIPPGRVVGIVARLDPIKDHSTLFRAIRILVDEMPGVQLLVVGDGPARANLENLCDELGIAGHVHFVGTRSDVPRLLRAVDVVALSSYSEAFPMALLEAMASARPVIATDVGGVNEIVVDRLSGYLVPPRDPVALAAGLRELLSSPERARRMGLVGRARIETELNLANNVAKMQIALTEMAATTQPRKAR